MTARNSVVRFALEEGSLREVSRYPTVCQPNTVEVDPRTGRVYVLGRENGELQILDSGERDSQVPTTRQTTPEDS